MSAGIPAALAQVAQLVRDAGVRAATARPDVNPPAAWVVPVRAEPGALGGGLWITVEVYLIAPDTGMDNATKTLDGMLGLLLAHRPLERLRADGTVADLDQGVTLPGAVFPLPAWKLTYETQT